MTDLTFSSAELFVEFDSFSESDSDFFSLDERFSLVFKSSFMLDRKMLKLIWYVLISIDGKVIGVCGRLLILNFFI